MGVLAGFRAAAADGWRTLAAGLDRAIRRADLELDLRRREAELAAAERRIGRWVVDRVARGDPAPPAVSPDIAAIWAAEGEIAALQRALDILVDAPERSDATAEDGETCPRCGRSLDDSRSDDEVPRRAGAQSGTGGRTSSRARPRNGWD